MAMKRVLGTLAVVIFMMGLGVHAEAQLAKQGTYSSRFGWHGESETFEFEKDHVFIVGKVTGTNFNDAGKGFLHNTSVVCPFDVDIVNGVPNGHGYCIVTDHDGDKAFLVFQQKCPADQPSCEGTFQWTGGTGKYTGLKGDNTYTPAGVPNTPSGYSVWKGEWQLP